MLLDGNLLLLTNVNSVFIKQSLFFNKFDNPFLFYWHLCNRSEKVNKEILQLLQTEISRFEGEQMHVVVHAFYFIRFMYIL